MTPEGKVKMAVKLLLHERGIWYYMPMQNGYGVAGIPDFICCWHGQFIAIETKAPKKEKDLTPMQERNLKDIAAHDGHAVVISDVKTLNVWLDKLDNERKHRAEDIAT